ncbi:MAG: dihydroxyacetone kinase family protein [Actinomycetota bacterium]
MTRLVNDAPKFARESIEGFVAAHPDELIEVSGGVVRAQATAPGEVAIMMGGGTGHYPAFAGWVGDGFGHGAACGNVFASPSEAQVLDVARAARGDAGVLFVPINYAGDILHFTAAAEQLRREGVDARLVAVTDDIASGPSGSHELRRGIAGSFLVIKVVGAAAALGYSLDDAERVARTANVATRSFGVAFSGCTLPGSAGPLFGVPDGRMAVGLGIHGEPGISEAALGTADEVADLLIDGLFSERAAVPGQRVAVLVNGLGATKYDELNLVFRQAQRRIEASGMSLVAPVVGEQVTSLDMAGVSISLMVLDDELETLWLAPAHSASFTRLEPRVVERRSVRVASATGPDAVPGSAVSQAAAARLGIALNAAVDVLRVHEGDLGRLDSVAGDGDHGAGMVQGATGGRDAAAKLIARGAGVGSALAAGGGGWSDSAGGASGALWGSGLRAAGAVLGDEAEPDASAIAAAVRAYADAVASRGGAVLGEKTMIDAVLPFADRLEAEVASGQPISPAWSAAAAAATEAAVATAQLIAARGRSRTHGARSRGTSDPGAVSFALLVTELAPKLT